MTRHRESRGRDERSQTERVILTLRAMLLRGDFHPGERLTELTLVPLLRASRTPVRHALDHLAHEGLLEELPTTGFRAREFAFADIWDALEIRGVLEGTAARLAAERLTDPEELAALRLYCQQVMHLLPMTRARFPRYIQINEAFHTELWRLSKSDILRRTIEKIVALPFAAPGALVFSSPEPKDSQTDTIVAIEQHRALVDAIERREGTRAEAIAREHARLAGRALERALQNQEWFSRMPGGRLIKWPVALAETEADAEEHRPDNAGPEKGRRPRRRRS
jgi:GntR family transcriptional regulator of vanillate catabolism